MRRERKNRQECLCHGRSHGDDALVVDELFLGGERLAAAELFEHVVNAAEREAGMLLLLPLAVRIETLALPAALRKRDAIESVTGIFRRLS